MRKPMTRMAVLLCALLLFFLSSDPIQGNAADRETKAPLAVHGVLDLTRMDLEKDALIDLNGEWEFYWNQLLKPEDFHRDSDIAGPANRPKPALTGYLAVPAPWDRTLGKEEITDQGYGTYRLLIKVDPADKIYGIRISNIRMAHRLFLNGKEAGMGGMPGTDSASTTMRNVPYSVSFHSQGGQIEILIQVADHSYFSGGILLPVTFGTDQAISRENLLSTFYDLSSVAALAMTALYYIGIILFRNQDRALLYFAIYCMSFAIFLLLHNEKILLQLIPALDYASMMRFKTTVLMLDFSGAALFFHSLSQQFLPRMALRFYLSLYVLYGLAALALPLNLTWRMEGIVFLGATSQVVLTISMMIRALYRGNYGTLNRKSALILLASTILILFHGILVTLNNSAIFQSRAIELITLVLFIFGMSLFLTKRYSDAYDALEISLKQIRKKEIQLLQAQVNPHFLYNTLNSIAALCRRRPDQAEQLTISFAQYLRGTFDFKDLDSWIPLSKELEHVRHYLSIEQVRYGERLTVTYEIDSVDPLIPPLILQPLVENAVKHGISRMRQGGRITVRIITTAEGILFSVSDNGAGMSEECLTGASSRRGSGIGLANIQKRLTELYGVTLTIESEPGRGSTVSFMLPQDQFAEQVRERK